MSLPTGNAVGTMKTHPPQARTTIHHTPVVILETALTNVMTISVRILGGLQAMDPPLLMTPQVILDRTPSFLLLMMTAMPLQTHPTTASALFQQVWVPKITDFHATGHLWFAGPSTTGRNTGRSQGARRRLPNLPNPRNVHPVSRKGRSTPLQRLGMVTPVSWIP